MITCFDLIKNHCSFCSCPCSSWTCTMKLQLATLLFTVFVLTICSIAPVHGNQLQLPANDGLEKACFEHLRNNPRENLEAKCLNYSQKKWNATVGRLDSATSACCALYDTLDCIQAEASLLCSKDELTSLEQYHSLSLDSLSETICKAVPYNKIAIHCKVH